MAIYFIDFYCGDELCHTTGESSFPTKSDYIAGTYSPKYADEIAAGFVDGYLDVKGLLGRVKPTRITYRIEFQ